MLEYTIPEDEINLVSVDKMLNDLYWAIRPIAYSEKFDEESNNLLYSCLDGAPNGIYGVMLLRGHLNGSTYSLVENPTTKKREYIQDQPEDPKVIYRQAQELINLVNDITSSRELKSRNM